jgi:hypothetical protein
VTDMSGLIEHDRCISQDISCAVAGRPSNPAEEILAAAITCFEKLRQPTT